MTQKLSIFVSLVMLHATTLVLAGDIESGFTAEELSIAKFWEDMGPTLRDKGVEVYAIRYHPDFRSWGITRSGKFTTKDQVIDYYRKFHENGHRITCAHVEPVTIDIYGDHAFARLIYEETTTFKDGGVRTGVWRMVEVLRRYGDTWQLLENTMVDITERAFNAPDDESKVTTYKPRCPNKANL